MEGLDFSCNFNWRVCRTCVLQVRDSQRSGHRLQEDLVASQQGCERLQGELQQVLLQLDSHVRLGNTIKYIPANKYATYFPAV